MKAASHLILALSLLLTGCSSSSPGLGFQSSLEHYVNAHANGDINVLREIPGARNTSQPRFGAISGSSESQGVLLGMHHAQDRNWYIYLVGTMRKRDVTGIRIMAVAHNPDPQIRSRHDFEWLQSPPDAAATSQYRAARLAAWRKNNPQAKDDDGFEMTFPAADDVFTLSIAGNTATAMDPRSGAKWTLVFGETTAKSQSAALR